MAAPIVFRNPNRRAVQVLVVVAVVLGVGWLVTVIVSGRPWWTALSVLAFLGAVLNAGLGLRMATEITPDAVRTRGVGREWRQLDRADVVDVRLLPGWVRHVALVLRSGETVPLNAVPRERMGEFRRLLGV